MGRILPARLIPAECLIFANMRSAFKILTKFNGGCMRSIRLNTAIRSTLILFLGLFVLVASRMSQAAPTPVGQYHLLHTYTVGGEGGWDYLTVDSDARRVYISRGTHVMVLDADSGKTVGDIPDTNGVHGIALAPQVNRGFVSDGRDNKVTIFDMKSLKVIGEAKTGTGPDAIIYDDGSGRVFTFNGRSNDATAIDAATGNVAGTVALGGQPEYAAADGAGHVYVNLEDKSQVVEFDSKNLKVVAKWALAPGESPSGMDIDRAHKRLFIGCHNQMMVMMDATNGRVVGTVPIGRMVDANKFDPETRLAFSSNGDGTLTVVHEDSPDKYTVVQNLTTQRGARTMAVDLKTHNLFTVTANFTPAPAATAQNPHPRPGMVPNSFVVLVYGM